MWLNKKSEWWLYKLSWRKQASKMVFLLDLCWRPLIYYIIDGITWALILRLDLKIVYLTFQVWGQSYRKNIQNTVVIIFIENGKGKKQYKIRIEILHRKFQMAKVQS